MGSNILCISSNEEANEWTGKVAILYKDMVVRLGG